MSKLDARILERLNHWSKRARVAGVRLRPKDITRVVNAQCKSFDDMRGEAHSMNLLVEEMKKRSALLGKIPKDPGYSGAWVSVPFTVDSNKS